jgi:nitroreductase
MELHEAIYSRRAVREYSTDPIDRRRLTRLIDAAIQAPSAVNEQPWIFTVVQDRELLGRISSESKASLLSAPADAVRRHGLDELLRNPQFDIFYRAPALIVISSATPGAWAVENCSLAAENLMLAACAEGLGTCWIGLAQGWLATSTGKALLGLPESCLPVAPIIVGRPSSAPAKVARKPPNVHWIGP